MLVPKPFQEKYGKAIYEDYYDGYGRFGRYDVYDLIPEWNKEMIPEIIRRIKAGNWKCSTNENDITNLQNYYEGKPITCELRWLGIVMACYDEDNFALASMMHDIGKLLIPSEILEKPGKLTNEEFDVIKTHVTIGYNLLKNSPGTVMWWRHLTSGPAA